MIESYDVPPCDTHGRFFDDCGHTANSPNSLADLKSQVDEAAVFSVLQFGAIVPPLSPWQGIRRLLPGYHYHGTKLVGPIELQQAGHVATLDPQQQSDELERLLDTALTKLIGDLKNPVLLFSGGVDSGIIASRLAALGYTDSLLLNYCFGKEDRESQLAEAMAKHLRLKFERVSVKRNVCDCLIEPGRVYPQPFGDHSTVPASDLAYAVVSRLAGDHRIILDGTGADGAFGMVNRIDAWRRVIRVPALFRQAASFAYGLTQWGRTGRVEYLFRILRRSIDMPLLSAVLAQNPLAGAFYRNGWRNSVDSLLPDWIGGWAGDSLPRRIVATDLALTCANTFAQKAQPILESAGHKVGFPFLETEVVSRAIAVVPHWQMEEAKAPLKRSLARYVPRQMVYRPKSGFVDPGNRLFFDAKFIEHFRAAAEPTSPIASVLNRKPLLKACDLLSRKSNLPDQTLNCIWAITFTDRWYRTAR